MTTTKYVGKRSDLRTGQLVSMAAGLRPLLYAGLLATLCVANVQAGDAPVNVAMCRGCHGIDGYRSAYPDLYSVPKLGGQQAQYLAKALQDYRSGLRPHATMRSIAATLSDQDIAALAAYYAGAQK